MPSRGLFVALLALLLSGVVPSSSNSALPRTTANPLMLFSAPPGQPRVVLVALDGIRWQEVFQGVDASVAARLGVPPQDVMPAKQLMPNLLSAVSLHGFALGDTRGPMWATGSFLSLPGYLEIFTGRSKPRCTTNECPVVSEQTLLDELCRHKDWEPKDIAVITSWEKIADATGGDSSCVTLSAGRHRVQNALLLRSDPRIAQLLDDGAAEPYSVGAPTYRRDRFTAQIALAYVARHRPKFLFVGLGDGDEFAHLHDYGGYLASLREADEFFGELFAAVESATEDAALVLVTTDHGRAHNFDSHGSRWPESGRVWLMGAGARLNTRWRPALLADIAPTLRLVFGLPSDTGDRAGVPLDLTLDGSPRLARSGRR